MKIIGEIRIEVPEEVKRLIEENPELKEAITKEIVDKIIYTCLLYTSPSPRDRG